MSHKLKLAAYMEMTKPRILLLVLVTTTIGFYLGGKGIHSWSLLLSLLFGTSLTCGGASVLNHYLERNFDKKMQRTKNRPIPKGTVLPLDALNFGSLLIFLGIVVLYIQVNILTAFLSLVTAFLYILVYTPMKRTSWLNTTMGAIPGAIPPLGGWAAATGTLNFSAGMLFLILFIWQHPHFYAIAWLFKEDYTRGGFKMLPCVEPNGKRMFNHILNYSLILIPVSLMPTVLGLSGLFYFCGALISGTILFFIAKTFTQTHTIKDARNLLKATVYYLPVLLLLIVLDVSF